MAAGPVEGQPGNRPRWLLFTATEHDIEHDIDDACSQPAAAIAGAAAA